LVNGTVPIDETVSAPANALTATFGYFRSGKRSATDRGGGGYYICNGKVDARIGNTRFSYDLDGKGLGAHALALADIAVSTGLHFEIALGYRSAKSGDLKSNGSTVTLARWLPNPGRLERVTTRFGFSIPFDPGCVPVHAGAN